MSRAAHNLILALRAFGRARQGATAVEFAFIAGPLLMLIFGILELALVFMASTALETATTSAARAIRTGELQTSGGTKESFAEAVCDRMSWLGSSCGANIHIDVRTYDDFTSLKNDPAQAGDSFKEEDTCWSPGGPADIVLVRTYYSWRIFTPLISNALVNSGSDKRLLSAVDAFRNEPYSDQAPTMAGC
jgi:Flp pilus assembly protein TadG